MSIKCTETWCYILIDDREEEEEEKITNNSNLKKAFMYIFSHVEELKNF